MPVRGVREEGVGRLPPRSEAERRALDKGKGSDVCSNCDHDRSFHVGEDGLGGSQACEVWEDFQGESGEWDARRCSCHGFVEPEA